MASAAYSQDRIFSIGRAFGRSFETIKGNPLGILGTTFVIGVLPGLIVNLLIYRLVPDLAPTGRSPFTATVAIVGVFSFLLAIWVQAALIHVTIAFIRGRTMGFGEALRQGLPGLMPLLIFSILAWFALWIGFALLIVPGVFLATMWVAGPGALIDGKAGILGAFGRSRALTKGARWKILGFELVILIVTWGGSLLAGISMGLFGTVTTAPGMIAVSATGIGVMLVNAVLSTLMQAWWGTAQTALYVELVDWKDGPDTDRLSDIFA